MRRWVRREASAYALWAGSRRRPVHPADRGHDRLRGRSTTRSTTGREASTSVEQRRRRAPPDRRRVDRADGRAPRRARPARPSAAALRRARRAPRAARRPGRPLAPARRRPRLHRPGLPARHARARRHPAGRLRAGAVAARLARLGGVDRDRGPRRALRPRRRGGALAPGARRPAARAPVHAPDAVRAPARLPAADRASPGAARVGATGTGRAATSTTTSATPRPTSTATASTGSRSTRSCSTRPGRRNTTRGSSTRTSSRTRAGMIARWRADGVRTVVWVAPWVNLDSATASTRRTRSPRALHPRPRPTTSPAMFVRDARRRAARRALVDGHRLAGRLHVAGAPRRGGASRPSACCALGVQGIKADDGEGWYIPDDVRFADGTTGARAAWGHGLQYRRSMQRALDEVHPGEGVLFGRPGWTGQQAVGHHLGRRPAVGLLVAAHARGRDADRGGVRASRTGRTTSAATSASGSSSRCPKELLLRWVQFGCFTPLMHAHGRFEQEAWTYDEETLDVYRALRRCCTSGSSPTCARPRRPRRAAGCRSSARWRCRSADARLGGRRRLRLRPVAVGGAGARGRRARGRGRPAARRLDRRPGTARTSRGGGTVVAARAARPHPGVGPARRADRHLSRRRTSRAGWATRRSASGRWRRRCGASRRAAVPPPGWPTAR